MNAGTINATSSFCRERPTMMKPTEDLVGCRVTTLQATQESPGRGTGALMVVVGSIHVLRSRML